MKEKLFMIGALFITIFTLSCRGQSEFIIGAIMPQTGPLSEIAEYGVKGLLLAQEQINSKGGILGKKIKIEIQDNANEPKNTVTIFNLMAQKDIKIIIVPVTKNVLSVKPIAIQRKIMLVALCMDPKIQKDSKYIFRFYEGTDDEAQGILKYFENLSSKKNIKVAILYFRHTGTIQEVDSILIPQLRKIGIKVVSAEQYDFSINDFKPILSKIKNSNPTHLILIGYGVRYNSILKALKELDMLKKVKILGGWAFIEPLKVSKEFLEGIIVAAPLYAMKSDKIAKNFVELYKNKYGELPHFEAAVTYNVIDLIAEAIKRCESFDVDKIIDELLKLKEYNSVLGKIEITSDGGMKVPIEIGVFKNGKLVPFIVDEEE